MTTPHDIATTGEPATDAPIWQPSVAPAAETGEAVSASDAVPDVGAALDLAAPYHPAAGFWKHPG